MAILSFVRIVASTVGVLIVVPLVAIGYKDGPAPNVTGGFEGPTCRDCHFDQPLNDERGTLQLTGVPEQYEAKHPYQMTVTLSRPGLIRGGFQIAARFTDGSRRRRQAGTWRLLDRRVQVVHSETDPPVQFLQHTNAGSVAADTGTLSWTMEWIAPEEGTDAVQFNVAGNASNDDTSPLGDYVYIEEAQSVPR
jgi:hypothetical protein